MRMAKSPGVMLLLLVGSQKSISYSLLLLLKAMEKLLVLCMLQKVKLYGFATHIISGYDEVEYYANTDFGINQLR